MDGRWNALAAAAALLAVPLCGCAPQPSSAPAAEEQQQESILVSSTPAAGATVSAPVNELVLEFSPPAILNEVTVTGPNGTMPMMLTPAGETDRYSLPLPGLGPGSYTADWRATAAGREHQGSFGFTVQ